jgi:hypothetical protein
VIRWENGLGGLGGYERIFFIFLLEIRAIGFKKSVRIRPIRLIRSPIVSQPNNILHFSLFRQKNINEAR